ncbi:MAG TPA: AsmA family protein, partial [Roseococcus sp.]|nr:AsmA family protein [Roseococcus sp.]
MGSRRALLASLALLAFVVLGIVAVQGLPALLDWDARRPQLAAIAGERLGRPVSLDGPVTLTLLPQPRLEAAQVRIGGDGEGIGIATRALHLRLDLGALLLGRVAVRELSLVGAEIRLPWPPANFAALAPPPWLTALDARLEDSRILIGGVALEGVRARLVAGGPAEALVADGALAWRGRELRFAATLGRAGDDGISPLDLVFNTGPAELQARGMLLPE